MPVDIDISHNFVKAEEWISELGEKEVAKVMKRTLNRKLATIQKHSMKITGREINTKKKTLFKKAVKRIKAKGLSLHKMEAALVFSGQGMPLLAFVKGNLNIIKQKGIKVRKRRKLKVEIKPGRTITLRKTFIQKKHSKQVFRGRRGDGFKKQGVSSLATIISRPKVKAAIEKMAVGVIQKEFNRLLQVKINETSRSVSSSPLKKV